MSDIAIRVENLSKQYRIGQRERYYALRDTLTNAIYAPFRRLTSLFGNPQSAIRNPQSEYASFRDPSPHSQFDIRHSKSDHIWALKDVSFEVKRGEVVGIIGRNGAGKSTLLKILSRITEPTEGYAEIHGRVGSLLEVGTGFHAELTGRENIYLNGAILGMKKAEIERKFDEIVAFAEVEKFIDTPVKHYSSGMHVRLAFAVAAHLEPEILLVDEVLAVGDAAFQKKCLGKMGNVAREGRTVLFISHNMTALRSLCTSGVLLSAGSLILTGDIHQCVGRYVESLDSQHGNEVNLHHLARDSEPSSDLRIVKVHLHSDSGRAVVWPGEPLVVELEIICEKKLSDVVFGVAISSAENVPVLECRSTSSYPPMAILHPGSYRLQCMIEQNPLMPGLYALSVGSRCASKNLAYLPGVMTFQVLSEELRSTWFEGTSGLVRISSRWTTPSEISAT